MPKGMNKNSDAKQVFPEYFTKHHIDSTELVKPRALVWVASQKNKHSAENVVTRASEIFTDLQGLQNFG